MTHLLDPVVRDRLVEFAAGRSVAVFDFDGTLAPVVSKRDDARMRRRTLGLLNRLCASYPCGVVSGRSLADTLRHLEGAPVAVVYGNHGLEPGADLERFEGLMTGVRHTLAQRLNGRSGIEIEDKRYSIAVHYRRSRDRLSVHQSILQAAEDLRSLVRVVEGICVVNLVPRGAPNKGDAVRAIQRRFAADQVLYVGDDITDEDVFCRRHRPAWLSVRVERCAQSAADYFLCRQREIDSLLARLIRLRQQPKSTSLRTVDSQDHVYLPRKTCADRHRSGAE